VSAHEQHEEEEHEDAERWLITYADMITLLMAFFIMMYSMSVVDLQKFEALAHAMGNAFGAGAPEGAGERPAGAGVLGRTQAALGSGGAAPIANRATLVNAIRAEVGQSLPPRLRDSVEVLHCGGAVTIRMKADSITFAAGEAALTADARRILDALGPALGRAGAPVVVEGHTCDLPISTGRFPSNWELSAQRAGYVMAHLVRRGAVPPEMISAAGFADTRPLAPNTSEANRRRNRRVDIVVGTGDGLRPAAASASAGPALDPHGTITLDPVDLFPAIDLPTRHRERTGRGPDEPPAH